MYLVSLFHKKASPSRISSWFY